MKTTSMMDGKYGRFFSTRGSSLDVLRRSNMERPVMRTRWFDQVDLEDICPNLRLFQHTELEHTPSNLYQQVVSRESFHSWVGGLPGVCSRGVL